MKTRTRRCKFLPGLVFTYLLTRSLLTRFSYCTRSQFHVFVLHSNWTMFQFTLRILGEDSKTTKWTHRKLGVVRRIYQASRVSYECRRFIPTLCTSAVQVSCESLRIHINRTIGTIVLNMLKTIAALGDLLQWRKRACDCLYDEPGISAIIELTHYRSSKSCQRDKGLK